MPGAKKGKKTRKYGRKAESMTQQRYNLTRRWETNKAKRMRKRARKLEKAALTAPRRRAAARQRNEDARRIRGYPLSNGR